MDKEKLDETNSKGKLSPVLGERLVSIKFRPSPSGDTQIFIQTERSVIVLGANDLGAWVEKVESKPKGS